MKNLKLVLALFIAIVSINVNVAQDTYASLDKEAMESSVRVTSLEYEKIDKTALDELLKLIEEKVDFPYNALNYSNSISLKVQVSINEFGELVSYHITDPNMIISPTSKSILEALSKVERVTPILVNGKPQAITVQLPITFR